MSTVSGKAWPQSVPSVDQKKRRALGVRGEYRSCSVQHLLQWRGWPVTVSLVRHISATFYPSGSSEGPAQAAQAFRSTRCPVSSYGFGMTSGLLPLPGSPSNHRARFPGRCGSGLYLAGGSSLELGMGQWSTFRASKAHCLRI